MPSRPLRLLFAIIFSLFSSLSLSAQQVSEPLEETTISLNRSSGVNVTGDTEICEGAETTLTVEGDYENYTWSNGSTQRSITVKKAGVYEVTVKTKGGCTLTTSLNVRTKICT